MAILAGLLYLIGLGILLVVLGVLGFAVLASLVSILKRLFK